MKQLIKNMVVGSPLEPVARSVSNLWKKKTINEIYDTQTIKVMQKCLQSNSNCVDVGCHKGDILRSMLEFAPHGKHYAFEPIPKLYNQLQQQFSPQVNVSNLALSDRSGEATFNYVTSNPAYSGFKQRSYPQPDPKIEVIQVKMDLLDNVIPAEQSIDLIKLDVEGGELTVLQGATQTIKRNQPIVIFEFGLGAADYYGTKPDQIYELLHDRCGLEVSLMKSWLSGKPPLSKQQFNTQFFEHINYYFIAYPVRRSNNHN